MKNWIKKMADFFIHINYNLLHIWWVLRVIWALFFLRFSKREIFHSHISSYCFSGIFSFSILKFRAPKYPTDKIRKFNGIANTSLCRRIFFVLLWQLVSVKWCPKGAIIFLFSSKMKNQQWIGNVGFFHFEEDTE